MYYETTHSIKVSVNPIYLEEHSSPIEAHYVWAYEIKIENLGTETVQLRNRAWMITDATGRTEEVTGPGVVGEQPILKPGQKFEYTSGAPLNTPSGFMTGHYEMINNNGNQFDVEIPLFSLDSPHEKNQIH